MPFKVIQSHRFWYQSKAHMRLAISDYQLTSYLAPFPSYGSFLVKFSLATVDDLTLTPSLWGDPLRISG